MAFHVADPAVDFLGEHWLAVADDGRDSELSCPAGRKHFSLTSSQSSNDPDSRDAFRDALVCRTTRLSTRLDQANLGLPSFRGVRHEAGYELARAT